MQEASFQKREDEWFQYVQEYLGKEYLTLANMILWDMNIIVLWYPLYYLEGVLKLLTAGASVATAVMMLPLAPILLRQFSGMDPDR